MEAKKTWVRFLSEACVLMLLSMAYCVGLVTITTYNPWLFLVICLLIPSLAFVTKYSAVGDKTVFQMRDRGFQLFVIESLYLLFGFIALLAIRYKLPQLNSVMSYCFLAWFLIQGAGFYVRVVQLKSNIGLVINSLMFASVLGFYFSLEQPLNSVLDGGLLLMWGHEVPWSLRWCYFFWFLLQAAKITERLPNFRQCSVHLSSVLFAMVSGSFFFVRLITACNLFLLDLIFNYSEKHPTNDFGVLSEKQLEVYEQKVAPVMVLISFIGCTLCTAYLLNTNYFS